MSKPSRFPDTLILIFGLIFLAQILTYLLPAGEYQKEPDPSKGKAYTEIEGQTALRTQFAAKRAALELDVAATAKLFHVSEPTVVKWELGAEGTDENGRPGNHIEENAGVVIAGWVKTGQAPSDKVIAAWHAATEEADIRERLVPGSYDTIESAALPWHTTFMSIPKGLSKAHDIIFFVFLIGGVLGIMRATGSFDALINSAISMSGKSATPLVIGTVVLFAIGSGVIGMAEEYVPFIAMLVTMSLALKLDAMVGIAIVFVAYAVGYGCAPINPFTVLVAQGVADLEPTSGWGYRVIVMVICLAVGINHILRYAKKVAADPSKSLVADIDYSSGFELPAHEKMDGRRTAVLIAFALTVITFVVGVKDWGWYFSELSACFLILGVLTAFFCGMSPNAAAKHFCAGAAELTTTALLIGFARTIEVVLVDGQIIDTIISGIASILHGAGTEIGAVGMLFVQTLCNFFIPSGSGQAYVTMPIMAPLADELGIQRQVAVLAYQFGDGFTNVITPTNAAFMGMLAIARVPYQRWLKFALPLMIQLYLVAALALVVAVWTGYS